MPVAPGVKTGDNEAHEHVELNGRALRLVHELDHHAYPTIAAWVEKHNRYAVWEAAMYERFLREPVPTTIGPGKRFKRRLKKVYLRLPMRPFVRFFTPTSSGSASSTASPAWSSARCLAFYDFLAWANVYEAKVTRSAKTQARCPTWKQAGRGSRPRPASDPGVPSTDHRPYRHLGDGSRGVERLVDRHRRGACGLGVGVEVAADEGAAFRAEARARSRVGEKLEDGP